MTGPKITGTLESALYADDLGAAQAFYGTILGLEELGRQEGRHVFYKVGSSVLLIFNPEATRRASSPKARFPVPPHGAKGGAGHYCFSAEPGDLAAWRDHLEQHGIEIEADFIWPGGARSLYVRDPAGNSIEFSESSLWFQASDGGAPP
ncbi:MAG: VOC family protein [Rhodobacteraceae bacterium]|nr:VOC family protein [Paracoccaceae bacterium]